MINPKEVKVGTKLLLGLDKRPFTVKAFDGRYAICTKPFNLRKTVIYSIIDFQEKIRGTNNLVFNHYDYTKMKDINQCLKDLQAQKISISHRNRVKIFPDKIYISKNGK